MSKQNERSVNDAIDQLGNLLGNEDGFALEETLGSMRYGEWEGAQSALDSSKASSSSKQKAQDLLDKAKKGEIR
jgi:hypothetical protein